KAYDIKVSGQSYVKEFAVNERIIFLKNDRHLGVKNGLLGHIVGLEDNHVTVKLDNDKIVKFNAKEYQNFDHGYAVTLHKSKGVTVDNCLTYASGKGWDRFIRYVALSRHRHNVHLYADKESYHDVQGLKRQLSSEPLRDNVLDYPLQFVMRRGYDATKFANNAVDKVKGTYHKTKDAWNFLFNYAQYKSDKAHAIQQQNLKDKQALNIEAIQIANLADLHSDILNQYREFKNQYGAKWYENAEAKTAYKRIEDGFYARNKAAYDVYLNHEKFERALALNNITVSNLEEWASAYTAESRVRAFEGAEGFAVKSKLAQSISENPESNRYVSSRNLWKEVNVAQASYVTRVKSGQIEGFTDRLNTLKQYLDENQAATRYWKKSKADDFNRTANTGGNMGAKSEDQNSTNGRQDKVILPEHQQQYEKISKTYNVKSEILAAKMMGDWEQYQPVLAVKFPYQATYEKVIATLKRKAENFAKRETIRAYISAETTLLQREQAAYKLNQDFKAHVGMGYEEGLIWGNVARTAAPEKIRQARAILEPQYLNMFDAIQEYQTLCKEAANAYMQVQDTEKTLKKSLGIKESGEIPKEKIPESLKTMRSDMFKLMADRHEMAFDINAAHGELGSLYQNNPAKLDEMIPNFRADKFQRHVALHQEMLDAKDRVEAYASYSTEDKSPEKMALAHAMTQRMGKHRFHLKRHNLNENDIWALSNHQQYRLDNALLSGEDKALHRQLYEYMLAKDAAAQGWRKVRTAQKQKQPSDALKSEAFTLNTLKNKAAFEASQGLGKNIDNPIYEQFTTHKFAHRNIDITQLIKSAEDYRVINDITQYKASEAHTYKAKVLAAKITNQYNQSFVYHKLKEHGISLTNFNQDALSQARENYARDLDTEGRGYYQTVVEYVNTCIAVAAAYQNKDKKLGAKLAQERNKLAGKVALTPSHYHDALLFEQVNFEKLNKHIIALNKAHQKTPLKNNSAQVETTLKQPQKYGLPTLKTRWNAERITHELVANPVETYSRIFGQPKKISHTQMKWSGGLIVTTTGNKSGLWHDFAQERGGSPIQAIMYAQGLSYVEALKEGANIANLSESQAKIEDYKPVQRISKIASPTKDDPEKAYKIKSAQSIWAATQPIAFSTAEAYMSKHRNIYDVNNTQLRFLPVGAKWIDFVEKEGEFISEEKINKVPAMVIASKDKEGRVLGVQRTYLDKETLNKNKRFDNPKLSKGSIKNGALLQEGS
ncbi:MAG: hypothetical protein DRP42_05470, partial [Tenericutes bacterium]